MKRQDRPELSICIPLYNKVDTLERTLESIVIQNLSDFEVVITNNASTDKPEVVLEKYQDILPLKIFTQPVTVPTGYNWFSALCLGEGRFIRLQLAGDTMAPNAIAPLLDVLKKREDIDFVHGMSHGAAPDSDSAKRVGEEYFGIVNKCRQELSELEALSDKVQVYQKYKQKNFNPFGNFDAVLMRSQVLEGLKVNHKAGMDAFITYTDLSMWLYSILAYKSLHVPVHVSNFFVEDILAVKSEVRDTSWVYIENKLLLGLFINPAFDEFSNSLGFFERLKMLLDLNKVLLSRQQKPKWAWKIIRRFIRFIRALVS